MDLVEDWANIRGKQKTSFAFSDYKFNRQLVKFASSENKKTVFFLTLILLDKIAEVSNATVSLNKKHGFLTP
jgi:hypothetical protein